MNLKENFTEIDADEILGKIANLSIKKWNYKSENDQRTHIGPTAQDFYAAFELGDDDKAISSIDPSGVALVAIQQLHETQQQLKEKATQVDKLQSEVELLRADIAQMTSLLQSVLEDDDHSQNLNQQFQPRI